MAWTAFPTWAVGQVSLASDWNTYVANNMQFLATPPILQVYRAGALSFNNTLATTTMPFDTVIQDSVSGYSAGSGLYTVAVAGTYAGWVIVSAQNSTGSWALGCGYYNTSSGVYKQGGYNNASGPAGAASQIYAVEASGLLTCTVGQTLGGYYQSNFAGNVLTGSGVTCMDIVKVSN